MAALQGIPGTLSSQNVASEPVRFLQLHHHHAFAVIAPEHLAAKWTGNVCKRRLSCLSLVLSMSVIDQ